MAAAPSGWLARWRGRRVAAQRFAAWSFASLAALFVVVTSGAFVRLTASGLGCENWPRCGDRPYPEQGFHAWVEFGNRLVALVGIVLTGVVWLAARRVDRLPPRVRWAALAAFCGTLVQIPLGGLTVILELHPVAVMSHFLLALAVVGVATVVALDAWGHLRGVGPPVGQRWWRLAAAAGVPVCAAVVVTGAVVTASGPHSGGDEIRRLGLEITDAVYVHVRANAVYGLGVLLIGWFLVRERRTAPGVGRLGLLLLGLLVVQMVLGEVQYRNALPWGLVLVHVFLAAAIWTLTVAVAYVLWRPPVTLLAARAPEGQSPSGTVPGRRREPSPQRPVPTPSAVESRTSGG
jgi:cytochrome c oxidase assembly protein subunit 15